MARHNKIIHDCSLRSIFKRPFKQWLRQWKPIHLCWLFEKLNLPIPKYFIGGGDGPPVFSGGNIDNATRNLGNAEDTPVAGWNKANLFIVALAWETTPSKKCDNRTYKIQWRNKTDSGAWNDLSNEGVLWWSLGGTDLVDNNPLIESEAICSSSNTTFVNNIERESLNSLNHEMLSSDSWTECQWAVEAFTALDGKEYEFRLYNVSDTAVVGTSLATITFQAPPTYQISGVTKDKDGNTLGTCECFLCKDNGDSTSTYIAYTQSDGSGNYSFIGITDNDATYFVISWKDDTPHVFDVTDHVLQPIAE